MIDGLRVDTTGTIRFRELTGSPIHTLAEKALTFEEEAKEELKELKKKNDNSCVVNIYRAEGLVFAAQNPSEALKLTLTPQDYVCSHFMKKMHACTRCGVFYKDGSKYKMLWKNGRYNEHKKPVFLNPHLLQKELKKVFPHFDLSLGVLEDNIVKFIAWEIKTEKGKFYIPWHNGCIIKEDENWSFTPKEFNELRSTYKVLRFSYATDNRKEFRIVCG